MSKPIYIDVCIAHKGGTSELVDMLNECLASLIKSEYPDEIVFNITVKKDEGVKRFNYNRMMAEGLKEGDADWCVMANDDLVFHKGWFSAILEAYNKFQGQFRSFGSWNPGWHAKRFEFNQLYHAGYMIGNEVSGWCWTFRRDALQEIMFFRDKKFQRVQGWYSDNLIVDALKENGIRHLLVSNSIVEHLLNRTMKTLPSQERYELQQGQKENYLNQHDH